MTSGAHDDGELGEVFLKLGKQGSTLAGVMDAFSIAVSIGLQYGVPLETYVSKFTNLPSSPPASPTTPTSGWQVDHGLHLPPPGPGLPALRDRARPRHLLRRRAPALPRDRLLRAPSRRRLPLRGRRRPVRSSRPRIVEVVDAEVVETKDTDGTEQREVPASPAKEAHTSAELLEQITGTAVDSPLCMTCGTKMRPAGSCYVCEGCGSTSGCS